MVKGKREAAKTVLLNDERRRLTILCAACGGVITKRLLKLARSGTAFTVTRGWRGNERVLRLRQHHDPKPPNGVGAVGDATPVANTTYTTNTTNSDGNLSNGVGSGKTALGSRERRERRQ
jgi:hypothetical protein